MTQIQAHETIEDFEMIDAVDTNTLDAVEIGITDAVESSEGSEIEFIEADIVEMEVLTEETPVVPPELSPDDIRLVEAILFASTAAIDERAIEERFPADRVAVIPEALEHLREQYAARGVNLVQRDKRWAFRTASDLGDQMRLEKDQQKKFTRAAMETLAIIGYHQPVTRAEIENIRGVATSAGALDTLMEAGWIKLGKRREVVGRPVTWQTTQGFLDHFGLARLEDLPGMEELKAAGLLDKRPAIEAMPTTSDLFDEKMDIGAEPITDEDLMGKIEEERDEALEIEIELEPDIELNLDSELNDEEEKI
jgi:segregation and condensation protein B